MHELVRDTVLAPLCGTGSDKEDHDDGDLAVAPAKPQLKKPPLFRVVLLNDDYTPMEFVVAVLQQIFRLGEVDATRVMLHVHNTGIGVAGVFTYEIAETRVEQVLGAARRHEFPLQCTLEPE